LLAATDGGRSHPSAGYWQPAWPGTADGTRKDSVMPEHDIRAAVQNRNTGMAEITALSWRAGAAGVAVAGLLTVALAHHPVTRTVPAGHRADHGSIVIPAQPPSQASGAGQVTSGAS
jgi:hypothetical protein